MRRRDFLKGATLAAGASAAGAFAREPKNQTALDAGTSMRVGKIALEEHFMVPDFVDYFAETYPNISPETPTRMCIAHEPRTRRDLECPAKTDVKHQDSGKGSI